ncbi:unnamed protein product, partial [Rotaria magnacalcarata]
SSQFHQQQIQLAIFMF